MINQHSLEAVRGSSFGEFRVPLYESYSFSNFVGNIPALFECSNNLPYGALPREASGVERIVTIFFDAFGWNQLEPLIGRDNLVDRFVTEGEVSLFTSCFPSTTAAHVTYFVTGVPPWESLIYEWSMYSAKLGKVVNPVIWSRPGEKEGSLLAKWFHQPESILPESQLAAILSEIGVETHSILNSKYARSLYNKRISAGLTLHPCTNFSDGLEQLFLLASKKERAFLTIYTDVLDKAAHRHGVYSDQAKRAIADVFEALNKTVIKPLSRLKSRSLVILTADHGGMSVDPKKSLYLDQVDPEISALIKLGVDGQPLICCGSSRDLFLHAKEGALIELRERVARIVGDKASIFSTVELRDRGVLGPVKAIDQDYLEALGDLVVLPHDGNQVLWSVGGAFKAKCFGLHGGLSPQEIEIPFMAMVV